jgi:PA-IL-like protein
MIKKAVVSAVCAVALLVAAAAIAQENATITLRSGEQLTAQLVDLGGVGFTVRVNGQERHIPQNDVAVIDFTGGSIDWNGYNGNQQVVFRNGQTIDAQLYDIGGTTPLKLTLKTPSGEREVSSSEVARIILARPSNASAVPTTGMSTLPATVVGPNGGSIAVPANQQWVPTGLTVRKGDQLTITATGEVQLSTDSSDTANPSGSTKARYAQNAPLPATLAGALIGRIGNGKPFGIGSNATFMAPDTGQLFLGVNDDGMGDNQGAFQVTIQRRARR